MHVLPTLFVSACIAIVAFAVGYWTGFDKGFNDAAKIFTERFPRPQIEE